MKQKKDTKRHTKESWFMDKYGNWYKQVTFND